MPITIPPQPFTFASESGNQPAAQLDSSFANIRNALTGIALQQSDIPPMPGTCTIQVNSTTQIQLNPGIIPLKVGGVFITRNVASAVTISNGGLGASQVNFVYATDSGGTTILELSTTGHATAANYGVEVKSGDETRTLVGMIRTDSGSLFQDAGSQRFLVSWFNRKNKTSFINLTANKTTGSGSPVELDNTKRVEFITWGDTDVMGESTITWSVNIAAVRTVNLELLVDGAVTSNYSLNLIQADAIFSGGRISSTHAFSLRLAEGYHHLDLYGSTSGDTLTVQGGTAGNTGVTTWAARIQG